MPKAKPSFRFPGRRAAMDGNSAVIACEKHSTDAAGAYPITPSTQMGEYWAEAAAAGHLNISGRPLIFIEPEGEHAAAAVTAGLSLSGLRAANFSSGQGIAYMHESLYAAVGKRLTYVLNIGARAMTKSTLNVHAGHDDYHCVDDTGFFQLFAKNAQHVADLNILAHRIAELALNPGIVAQDGFLTTHLIESLALPERELIEAFLGRPDDMIDTPTAAQRLLFGATRRRIPKVWDVDNPLMAGVVENQDAYMQSVAAQRPYFFAHIAAFADEAFAAFYPLTGRRYQRVMTYRVEDADYLLLGQGSIVPSMEAVADYLRASRGLKVGVVNLLMFRPFPADQLSVVLQGRKGVAVLERVDQPLAADLPLMREVRATVSQCIENGLTAHGQAKPFAHLAAYARAEIPLLYSGSFGLGSRDLQAEGIIAAVENMLAQGKQKRFFYLGIDFLHPTPYTPTQEVYQESLQEAYPQVRELALRGSENPDLMPKDGITVRIHSVGGWGAITTGKNLALTLFDLLGLHIKANPKYGSEKKGQPTTYFLAAAPEPIRMNCELIYVDVVLSPDPNVFHHTHALAGLKQDGVFILQSEHTKPDRVWADIPPRYRQIIRDQRIKVYFLDAFKIAREEASDADLQLRMQGIAFQGAFFAASGLMQRHGLDEAKLLQAIRDQLQRKFGAKGARVVEDNLRVVQRGLDELQALPVQSFAKAAGDGIVVPFTVEPAMPMMLKRELKSGMPVSDVHRFWEQTGNFYQRGKGGENLADPHIAMGVMPAASSVFRDMTGIRFNHPRWIAENCTACGECYTVCPDTAIPGLVSTVTAVLDTVVQRVQREHAVVLLPRAARRLEQQFAAMLREAKETDSVDGMLEACIETVVNDAAMDKESLQQEFAWFKQAWGGFPFALTRPYFTLPEKKAPGSGALFSITVNPFTCKGCMECVNVCKDDALRSQPQTEASVENLRQRWAFWLDLPNTPPRYIRVEDLEQRIGVLESLLLNKDVYLAFRSGDGACMGCGEKTVLHLFIATVEALMRPRVAKHIAYLGELIERLAKHVQLKLTQEITVGDLDTLQRLMGRVSENRDLTLSDVASAVEKQQGARPIDREWLHRVSAVLQALKDLRWRYTEGVTGRGRVNMGILNATGCSSVWGSTYPYNPYPFPWANHLFQDSASMAMGVLEGHMASMAQGFAAVRKAELELADAYRPGEHDVFFQFFNWQQFSDDEFALCPPVAVVGGDGAMYDIGFQNLSRAMMSGKPLKIVVLDTQVYSNTGGQACTSGFLGQVSDMAPFSARNPGKQEIRKEIALIAMAHRTTYVMQSTIAFPSHMIEGFIEGLMSKRPALFNCYTSCQPEHGIGDDMSHHQAKLAVESRAYPLLRYNPDLGETLKDCLSLDNNPARQQDWPQYTVAHREGGRDQTMVLPMTFADFAMTEGRFRKHFRTAPRDTWNDAMLPLADYLDLDAADREGRFPFIWTVNKEKRLSRLLVSQSMVASCEDRRHFWHILKSLAGLDEPQQAGPDAQAIRQEVVGKITAGLLQWVQEGTPPSTASGAGAGTGQAKTAAPAKAAAGETMAPWIDSAQCTACGECIKLNPQIFAYNDKNQAVIVDPQGGPYRDLVKAAERCTAQIIHPGLPRDRGEKDIERWIKRGEKYNG